MLTILRSKSFLLSTYTGVSRFIFLSIIYGPQRVRVQKRRRPAWASAQTDQHLCFLLFGKHDIKTFNFLAIPCSWGDWFESCFVGNPDDRFCCVEAHNVVGKHWRSILQTLPMSTSNNIFNDERVFFTFDFYYFKKFTRISRTIYKTSRCDFLI